jgi:hypothetical protein
MKNGGDSEHARTIDPYPALGTLLEAAIRDQKAIGKAVDGLNGVQRAMTTATAELPRTVAREVDASLQDAIERAAMRLVERFEKANVDAERAEKAYCNAVKFSLWKGALPVLGIAAVGAAAIVAVAWMLTPSLAEIQSRRDERDALEQRIAWLQQHGANGDFTKCIVSKDGKKTRLCVKLDSRFGDEWSGYRIIADR